MNNQTITITTNGGVEDFKVDIGLPHGLNGVEVVFKEQPIPTSGHSKECPELTTYKLLESEGYSKGKPLNGSTMWTRGWSPSIFTDTVGACLAGEPRISHPISVEWLHKAALSQ